MTVALHPRARTTRLWAVGVLVLGTLALAAYLATSWVLSRGEALSARAAGLASGAAGLLVGAVILALTGVL